MKTIKRHIILIIIFSVIPNLTYAQEYAVDCIKILNSTVYENLLKLNINHTDLSSDNIKIIFELHVSDECGRIDSVVVKKSNLNQFGISERALISLIIGNEIPCLWNMYFSNKRHSDGIVYVYNSKFVVKKKG